MSGQSSNTRKTRSPVFFLPVSHMNTRNLNIPIPFRTRTPANGKDGCTAYVKNNRLTIWSVKYRDHQLTEGWEEFMDALDYISIEAYGLHTLGIESEMPVTLCDPKEVIWEMTLKPSIKQSGVKKLYLCGDWRGLATEHGLKVGETELQFVVIRRSADDPIYFFLSVDF